METIPPPTEKTNPLRRKGGKSGIKDEFLKKERRSVMNISGIPQLHAAAGFSLGEVVGLAKSHQSRTLGGSSAFSLLATTELNWLSADYKRKSTLKQEFRILADTNIV